MLAEVYVSIKSKAHCYTDLKAKINLQEIIRLKVWKRINTPNLPPTTNHHMRQGSLLVLNQPPALACQQSKSGIPHHARPSFPIAASGSLFRPSGFCEPRNSRLLQDFYSCRHAASVLSCRKPSKRPGPIYTGFDVVIA